VLPNGTAPQRALGPPWTPMATSPSVLRERDHWRPHLCTQVRIVTPETGSRRFETERQPGNKEGERAGIEPARPPTGQGQLDAVRAVQRVHTVAFDEAPLEQAPPRPPSRARASRGARVTVASDDAQVWKLSTRVRRADLHQPCWRPGGLDARQVAPIVPVPLRRVRYDIAPMKTESPTGTG
jgi:hypothetical protein